MPYHLRDPVDRWDLWEDDESLKDLIVAKLFHIISCPREIAAMLIAKDSRYIGLKGYHVEEIIDFVMWSPYRKNPYPELQDMWETDPFGNRTQDILEARARIAYWRWRAVGPTRRR